MPRVATILLAAGALLAAGKASYLSDMQKWRADREASLRKPDGWLSVAGLFWLHEGANVVGSDPQSDVVLPAGSPKRAGILRYETGKVTFEPVSGARTAMKPDDPGPPDVAHIGDVSFTVINRGAKMGARLRDPNAATRRNFNGCQWFPIAESWHVRAKWVAYPEPKKISITNILGMTDEEPSTGYAEFQIKGRTFRLEPVTEDDDLFFMFKDTTSGRTTYGAGRFLYTDKPKDGSVELDFNKAENPPCAFTAFATCPLPPKQNALPVAVEAGEKAYRHH